MEEKTELLRVLQIQLEILHKDLQGREQLRGKKAEQTIAQVRKIAENLDILTAQGRLKIHKTVVEKNLVGYNRKKTALKHSVLYLVAIINTMLEQQ